ncbi:MAG: cell wall hydrolase [Muribaculaceae bacterium]|nr:cell wall hydrolase [Muribaculaceae bacterium]MCM1492058.1 cell wall hydrolase [Muribaculaceae bacterium]
MMKTNAWKRLLALLLALAMVWSTPATAQAAKNNDNTASGKETTEKNYYNKKNLRLMSSIIYCEARGESYKGQLAVGMVVMNRVHSSKFPDTVKDVIYQKHQFSPVSNGSLKKALKLYDKGKFSEDEQSCIKAAKAVLKGKNTLKLNGKKTDMSSYLFFSVYLKGSRLKIGNHNFK